MIPSGLTRLEPGAAFAMGRVGGMFYFQFLPSILLDTGKLTPTTPPPPQGFNFAPPAKDFDEITSRA